MNWVDIVILVILVGFVAAAYTAGLIREVVTLIAVLAGIVVAGLLYDSFAADVLVFVDDEDAAQAIAFLILFGSVYLIGQIAAYVLKFLASIMMLGWADRVGGAGFGLIKGLLVIQVLLIVLAAYPSLDMDGPIDDSAIGKFFVDDASFLLIIMPGEFEDRIDLFLDPPPPVEG
jgi:membrane protein required for colicin V production